MTTCSATLPDGGSIMRLRLETVGQPEPLQFEYEGDKVTIGRAPECEFLLKADQNEGVSWKHAHIESTFQKACLSDLGSTNGTFVNDRRIEKPVIIKEGDYIRLGQKGLTLKVAILDCKPNPKAASVRPAPPPPQRPFPDSREAIKHKEHKKEGNGIPEKRDQARPSTTRYMLLGLQESQSKVYIGAAIATAVVLLVIGGFLSVHRRNLSSLTQKTEGISQQTEDLSSQASDLTRRSSHLSEQVGGLAKRVQDLSEDDAQMIFKRYSDAVYFVQGPDFVATAFAIDSAGTFATNAHVAQPLRDDCLRRGKRAVVISQGGGRTFRITEAIAHGGYRDTPSGFSPDVGILKVEVPDGKSIPAWTNLATDEELRQMEIGAPLVYIGFPVFANSDYDSLSKVNARFYRGHLVRTLTLSEEKGHFGSQQLLEHDMLSWGGASGSPLFNKQGKVVALHFAGNKVEGRRAAASPKWAMRVDLLREVLHAR